MKAQSVSELVKTFISCLEHNFKWKYTADTTLQYTMELSLLISIVAMDTGNEAPFPERTKLTVQEFAQLMWRQYYRLAESEDE